MFVYSLVVAFGIFTKLFRVRSWGGGRFCSGVIVRRTANVRRMRGKGTQICMSNKYLCMRGTTSNTAIVVRSLTKHGIGARHLRRERGHFTLPSNACVVGYGGDIAGIVLWARVNR